MAQFYLDAIRNVQPFGPYTLVGYSLGGLVAFEMARQFAEGGEQIASLILIDSYPSTEPLPLRKRIRLEAAQLCRRASDLAHSKTHRSARMPLGRVRHRMYSSGFLALTRYRPGWYSGKIKFVRAQNSHYPDPAPIWARFAAGVEIDTVPGDHHEIISVHSEALASVSLPECAVFIALLAAMRIAPCPNRTQ